VRKYQVAGVVALGAAMVAATLIVGLGVDKRNGEQRIASRPPLVQQQPSTPAPASAPAVESGAPPAAPKSAQAQPRVDAQKEGVAKVTVTTSGSVSKDKKTLKVVSAPTDLSGQRELAWAADNGRAVGDARCTQNFQFNPQSRAGVRPTMLLCWRTSPTKSVYTVLVDLSQKPSEKMSVAAIDKAWKAMS